MGALIVGLLVFGLIGFLILAAIGAFAQRSRAQGVATAVTPPSPKPKPQLKETNPLTRAILGPRMLQEVEYDPNTPEPSVSIEEVRRILDEGADPNGTSVYGQTVLYSAVLKRRLDLVKLLLERGADPQGQGIRAFAGVTPLMSALESMGPIDPASPVNRKLYEIIKLLLERTTNVALTDAKGNGLLKIVAWNGDLEMVKLLVSRGAPVDQKTAEGMTPLMWAAHEGHVEVMKFLIKNGADVNARNVNGWTALQIAIEQRDKNVVDLLLKSGAEGAADLLVRH
jgi:ankyrin repeat protein